MLMASTRQSRTMELRIDPAETAPLPEAGVWRALAANAAEPNPYFEHWFLVPALQHLRNDEPVWIAQGWVDGELVGLMPLSIRRSYGRMPVRHVSNWAHYQCFMGAPLVAEGWMQAWWKALLFGLDEADWARGLLSISMLDPNGSAMQGLVDAASALGRPSPIVHHRERAMLASDMDGDAYLEAHIRPKKRKEWRRLGHRLAEMGTLLSSTLTDAEDIGEWCATFMALEAAGWKGEQGSTFAGSPEMARFFESMIRSAFDAHRLDFQRLDLNDQTMAMLINFRTPPGSWSFKIAHDPELARFSPGVMIEIDNLMRVLADPALDWMDSCAVEDHPMINSLWAQRREIVQVSVPLSGLRRRLEWIACRAAETGSARLRAMRKGKAE